jgi:hypothetical protein
MNIMRSAKASQQIALTSEEMRFLEHTVSASDTPSTLVLRARIVLAAHAHPELSNQQIATMVGTTEATVRLWRRRWVKRRTLANASSWETPPASLW